MAIKYYSKLAPQNPIILPNGQKVVFSTVDGTRGWFATQQEALHQVFADLMRQGEYGLSEVTAETFSAEYLEKKRVGISPPGREEFTPSNAARLIDHAQRSASAAAQAAVHEAPRVSPTVEPATIAAPTTPTAQAPVRPNFEPEVGRRKSRRQSASTPTS